MKKKPLINMIASKYVHSLLKTYIPKRTLLQIVRYSKRLQSVYNVSIEDYEIFNLPLKKNNKNLLFSNRTHESVLKSYKIIFELASSSFLYTDNIEIPTPTPIYKLTQLSNGTIVASTNNSLLFFDNKTMKIFNEYKSLVKGAFMHLIDLGDDKILCGTYSDYIIILNMKSMTVEYEITGKIPLLLSDGRIAYSWQNQIIRIITIEGAQVLQLKTDHIDFISQVMQLKDGSIITSSWDKTIKGWDLDSFNCLFTFNAQIELICSVIEINKARLVFTATDNAHIYIFNPFHNTNNDKVMLQGHNDTVIQVMYLSNTSNGESILISASYDGKIKVWVEEDNNGSVLFLCKLTLFLYDDYIRSIVMLNDNRLCLVADTKVLRIVGVTNYYMNYLLHYVYGCSFAFEITDDSSK